MDKLQMTQSPTTGFGSRCEYQMPIELWSFFPKFFNKNTFLQEEWQHMIMSILIQDGE